MDAAQKFNVGDGVAATEGPMKNIYGIVIMFDKDGEQIPGQVWRKTAVVFYRRADQDLG